MTTLIIFLVTIVILVVVHELGHFSVAKIFGVKVEEFGVGYPPRAKKLFTWKGTLFTLNWLPFGGFVKIFGEEDGLEQKPDSFGYQKLWKRALIVLAGIFANLLLAMVLYSISFGTGFLVSPDSVGNGTVIGDANIMITQVLEKSPAQKAGISTNDEIKKMSVDSDSIVPHTATDVVDFVQKHPTSEIDFTLMHAGAVKDILVTPKADIVSGKAGVGIALSDVVLVRLPFWQAIGHGVSYTFQQCFTIFATLGLLIRGGSIGGHSVVSQLSGPIGIAQITGQAFSLGFSTFLSIMALISVNLAVINLLPFPALDGGRLILEFFATKGKSRIPTKVVSILNQAGFAVLLLLMLFVTYQDIARMFH